ncbi:uncharacterized protein [Gossypium hirsutum]|uniref:Uncharacterized protein isoform X2 n=1 Tax=Gossypium hirsutum TaxID=3635 RepID=A0ABM3BJ18_GOSHI|nr:uncharacterized protein LOC107948244 isoform X2 [Gossypium hirsutum]
MSNPIFRFCLSFYLLSHNSQIDSQLESLNTGKSLRCKTKVDSGKWTFRCLPTLIPQQISRFDTDYQNTHLRPHLSTPDNPHEESLPTGFLKLSQHQLRRRSNTPAHPVMEHTFGSPNALPGISMAGQLMGNECNLSK